MQHFIVLFESPGLDPQSAEHLQKVINEINNKMLQQK